MTINLSVPQTMQELRPRITVIGVGGAGCNAVNNMIDANLEGVDFLVANTDGQSLAHSMAPRKIQLGTSLTGGLGAGSKPEMGRKAAEESLDEVLAELADSHMVFITAGMGGGTGTGAAPVIARAAKERGILTVGVITKPFDFEGKRRMEQADAGVEALQAYVDTLIVIPNQNLFRLANERTTLADTFHMADAVLHQGVCGVTDLMIKPGLINLDFADIRAVMSEMGKAMMGTGEASGETRAIEAAESAINNPLLDDSSMKGAKAVLINITGGMDMTLFEVDEAANRIREEVDPDATIIFGSAFEEKLEGVMRVSVVATGIDALSISTPLPLKGTADTDCAGTSNEIMSSEKVKQVINFGHLAPASFIQPTYDLSVTEDTKNTPEEVDPQSTQTASLEQQMKPEQHKVEAADDPELCHSKQEDNNMMPEHEQLDLETAANQAKTIARVEDERPAENISAESNAFAETSQRSKA
ncbi:MAG: cell division protein FtsZ, partial [Candidatus Puniceispirillaceae bacterium]